MEHWLLYAAISLNWGLFEQSPQRRTLMFVTAAVKGTWQHEGALEAASYRAEKMKKGLDSFPGLHLG